VSRSLPVILSLETATLGGSVFLGRGNEPLAERNGNPQISHSDSLLSDINDSLECAGMSLQDIDVFACTLGPGSFTGLRIGLATLKALAVTLERPCAGIPTLQAVAHAAGPSRATVALLPAGRGEVFAQLFSVSEGYVVTEVDAAAHLTPQKLVEKYATFADLTWAGEGAHLQSELLRSYALHHGIIFRDLGSQVSSQLGEGVAATAVGSQEHCWKLAAKTPNLAKHVAALALQMFQNGKLQSPDMLNAIYVRPSDAELKEQCR
jgi:tRNA threonylcarbamoyladenosine biosynthesis protein TsaB